MSVLLLLGLMIYLNYWHALEKKYVGGYPTKTANFIGYYLLYFIPFATAFLLQLLVFKNQKYWGNGWFWFILIIAPALFSFRVNFNFHQPLIAEIFEGKDAIFYRYSFNWIVRALVLIIPIVLIWYFKDRLHQPLYGTNGLDTIQPYFIMVLLMLPLLALAATQPDFQEVYPKAQLLKGINSATISGKMKYVIFELCYGFDFVSIEIFFRGFLVLSLLSICGYQAIIPIACFYCSIHLGSPMGEAISSFFGGLLLGIIVYNTGSIWGGLFVHLGIAWLMEL
ncbi:MAG: CPBP family intramembrane glutamic endopeptidase, partial [Ferruginibacter sp.]